MTNEPLSSESNLGVMFRAAIMLSLAGLNGCSDNVPDKAVSKGLTVYNIGLERYAIEFPLNDGTRCVVVEGKGTGLACDWRHNGQELTK